MFKSFKEKGLVWPLVVVCLLLSSVLMMVGVVFMARSDGGAQVIENYYEKAVAWDSLNAGEQEFRSRGITPVLVLSENTGILTLLGPNRAKVAGLKGKVELARPQSSAAGPMVELSFMNADSTYLFPTGELANGLWDFRFTVTDQSTPLAFSVRKEVR